MRPDLDLVLLDFEEIWDRDPQAAVQAVESLLRDHSTCEARVEMLRQMERYAEKQPELPPLVPREDFTREIELLVDPGLVEAVDRNLIARERLGALICDPDALLAAHGAISRTEHGGSPVGPAGDTRVEASGDEVTGPSTSGSGFTELVRRGRWREVEARLRPWLPDLLRHMGLSDQLTEPLMEFIGEQASQLGGRRFSEVLPAWLDEFAREQGAVPRRSLRTEEEWRDFVEPSALRQVLQVEIPHEPDWVRRFRDAAIEERIGSLAALLNFEPVVSLASPEDVAALRRELVHEASDKREEARRLFERD